MKVPPLRCPRHQLPHPVSDLEGGRGGEGRGGRVTDRQTDRQTDRDAEAE